MGMISNYVTMTNSMSRNEDFFKREVAPRILGFGLIAVVATEFIQTFIALPIVAAVKGELMLGKKIYYQGKEVPETWEKHWQIMEVAKRILNLFLAILSSIFVGFIHYKFNNSLLAKLELTDPIDNMKQAAVKLVEKLKPKEDKPYKPKLTIVSPANKHPDIKILKE